MRFSVTTKTDRNRARANALTSQVTGTSVGFSLQRLRERAVIAKAPKNTVSLPVSSEPGDGCVVHTGAPRTERGDSQRRERSAETVPGGPCLTRHVYPAIHFAAARTWIADLTIETRPA